MEWPRPAKGTHLFMLDDEAVLYSQQQQELYSFNTGATMIWCCLELGNTLPETTGMLSGALRCSPDAARARIETQLAQWKALGDLAGSGRPKPAPRPQTREIALPGPKPELPPLCEKPGMVERRYRLLGTTVRVCYQSEEEAAWVHPIVAHLETAEADFEKTVSIMAVGEGHGIYVDGRPYGKCSGLHRIAPYAKAALWQVGVSSRQYFLHLHAGVVSDGQSLILLPAPSGRGKSTLTAGLIRAGYQYFSDEAALLEEGNFHTIPVPLSLCVKSGACARLAPLYPELAQLAAHERPDRKLVRYMPPPARSLPKDLEKSLPVRRIIFPCYDPDADTTLQSLSKADALARLLDQCLAVPLDLTYERVAALVRWIASVKTHELTMSSLDKALELVGPPSGP